MDLSSLRVKELTEICKKLGIRSGGLKAELVERLASNPAYHEQFAKNGVTATASARTRTGAANNKRGAHAELASAHAKKQRSARLQLVDAINAEFDKFRDDDSADSMTDDGILAFCDALGIDAQDPVILVLSWLMGATTMCEFTRSEFVRGLEALGCATVDDVRLKLPALRAKLLDTTEFRLIYSFTFGFAKDPTQKSLALDIATGLWELLLPARFPLLPHWLAFVKTHCRNSISKDVWMQVLDFGAHVRPDLSNFDANGAWPVVLDDFVDHMHDAFKARGVDTVLHEARTGRCDAMAIDA